MKNEKIKIMVFLHSLHSLGALTCVIRLMTMVKQLRRDAVFGVRSWPRTLRTQRFYQSDLRHSGVFLQVSGQFNAFCAVARFWALCELFPEKRYNVLFERSCASAPFLALIRQNIVYMVYYYSADNGRPQQKKSCSNNHSSVSDPPVKTHCRR